MIGEELRTGLPTYCREFGQYFDLEPLVAHRMRASDGHVLTLLERGDPCASPVLVLNPIATPALMLAEVIRELAGHYRVFSLESRSSPFLDEEPEEHTATLQRLAQDVAEVADHFELLSLHVAAWCSAGTVAAQAAVEMKASILSAALISPSAISALDFPTPFSTRFLPTLFDIAEASPARAVPLCKMVREAARNGSAASGMPDWLERLTTINLRSDESLRSFAKVMFSYGKSGLAIREEMRAVHAALFAAMAESRPTLVVHAKDDRAVDHRCSVDAAQHANNTTLILRPSGGHFFPCFYPRWTAAVLRAHFQYNEPDVAATTR